MGKVAFILINVIFAIIIGLQTDDYNHQLMFQFKGLMYVAFAQCMLAAGAFAIMIHEYMTAED